MQLEQQLHLTLDQLVGIYNGTIRYWNDSTFIENNPNCTFPNASIIVLARADKSGSTDLFTHALAEGNAAWNETYGYFAEGLNKATGQPYHWNPSAITYYGVQTDGINGLLLSFENSIGYLSVADVTEWVVHTAYIKNDVGEYIYPTTIAVQKAMDYFSAINTELNFPVTHALSSGAYPIAGFTHFLIYKTNLTDCVAGKELVRYIYWALTESAPRHECEILGFAPLSADLVARVKRDVLEHVYCNGQNLWEQVLYDIENEGKVVDNTWITIVAVSVPLSVLIVGALGGYILYQRIKYWKMINSNDWFIPIEDIVFYQDARNNSTSRTSSLFTRSARSLQSAQNSMGREELDALLEKVLQWPGKWNGYDIGVRLLEVKRLQNLTKPMKQEMLIIKNKISHPNIVRFFGLTFIDDEKYIIGEFCRKGCLADLLQDNRITMTNDFKLALALDICQGMLFLHTQHFIHGNLKSHVCFVDNKWTVKVGDWEFVRILTLGKENAAYVAAEIYSNSLTKQNVTCKDFWVAPEILRANYRCALTTQSDIYSFAILLQEIYTQEEPYSEHLGTSSSEEIIHGICSSNLRPKTQLDLPVSIRQVMEIAWTDNPASRPSFEQILKLLKRNNPLRKSVMDSVIQSMEEYTQHLEECVEEKTVELESSKKQLETVMSSIIPSQIVNCLSVGESLDQKDVKILGVICLEIMSRDDEYKELSPTEKLKKLNSVCSYIDLLVHKYSAFRYSSTGTSFTIVVGIGDINTNENEIANKTAHMCVDFLTREHMENSDCTPEDLRMLQLSIGAHVGSTATGIVETDTPQFVLLSDLPEVVRSLSRSCDPSKIHITHSMRNMIISFNNFSIERSGLLIVKGVEYETCWLTGRTQKWTSGLPEKKEEKCLSPSNHLALPNVEKTIVPPPPNEKIKYVNETRPQHFENGNLKMSNGKPKNMYPKRRVTKQRNDALPDVIEDSVDVLER
ncbi:guanylate cyclase 2G-like [Saccostrea cucullata]|uniref:guanylate cyclase 2G-like n=1 Tax=Saccostrea cuccullata TaxID=36930 RepID=UPI002ED51319